MSKSSKVKIACLSLLVITLGIIYAPSLNSGFQHDDIANLTSNHSVQIDSLSLDSLYIAASSSESGKLNRPVSMLSFALNYYFGDQPYSFKVTNLILHILTCILVYVLIINIKTIGYKASVSPTEKKIIYFALACTFIWAIHPVHISTVAYVVQRMTILSAFFSLASILFYIAGRKRQLNREKSSYLYYAASSICIILGVLSKENAVLAILLIMLIELMFIQQTLPKEKRIYNNKLFIYAGSILLLLSCILILPNFIEYLINQAHRSRDYTLIERLLTQTRVLSLYLKWFYIPNVSELGLFHDDITISTSFFKPISTAICTILLITIGIIAIKFFKRTPIISFGIAWFFIGHILESTIIPLEIAYEHRNYLPYIGLVIASVAFVQVINLKFLLKQKHIALMSSVVIVLLISSSLLRSFQWSSPLSFAVYEASHHPKSVRANHNLGMMYRTLVLQGHNEFKHKAYSSFSKAAELNSGHIQPEAALIQLSYEMKDHVSPEIINSIANKLGNFALKLDHINLLRELVLCRNQNCVLPKDAAKFLLDATNDNNRLHEYDLNHSIFMSTYAHFILERGYNPEDAEPYFKRAIETSPHHIQNYTDYANLLLILDRKEDAGLYLDKALSIAKNTDFKDEILAFKELNNL